MTSVRRAGGTDAEVTGLRYEAIGTGQSGSSYRFHLDAKPGDAKPGDAKPGDAKPGDAHEVPASVVIKTAAGAPDVRKRLAPGYRSEVGFYRTFAPTTLIRAPRCWSAELSADSRRFTLVMEDAHPARPGRQVDGCTVGQATLAV
nr:hypothetical protein [Micromonospora sp. DSM 115978]